jgi:hypothetical protein
MKKVLYVVCVITLTIGVISESVSAKTLYVVGEDTISNSAQTPVDVFSVIVKVTTYNNQCMALSFSGELAVGGGISPGQVAFYPLIDGIPALPTGDGSGKVYWTPGELGYYDMAGFMWYQCGLKIGKHTVTIQYEPVNSGNTAYIRSRLLKIDLQAGKIVP